MYVPESNEVKQHCRRRKEAPLWKRATRTVVESSAEMTTVDVCRQKKGARKYSVKLKSLISIISYDPILIHSYSSTIDMINLSIQTMVSMTFVG